MRSLIVVPTPLNVGIGPIAASNYTKLILATSAVAEILGCRLRHFLLILLSTFMLGSAAQASEWARSYGGLGTDAANSVRQTADGGYIVAGSTESFGAGGVDAWVFKLDASGTIVWQKTYGGAGFDEANSIRQTSDGGYVVAGATSSYGAGAGDAWVLKLDPIGNVVWQRTYGGSGSESANAIQQTGDGGYIVAGTTASFGAGGNDAWILKLDATGNVIWQKTYGGTGLDSGLSVQQTADGGYVLSGDVENGLHELWVLKLDPSGDLTWQKTIMSTAFGFHAGTGNSVQQVADGGYVAAGYTYFGAGSTDAWLVKLDASGNLIWQKTYGGTGTDTGFAVQATSDGGFVLVGAKETIAPSLGGVTTTSEGALILKLDAMGNVTWQKTYGTANAVASSVQQTNNGGYIVAGLVHASAAGQQDAWLLKLDANGSIAGCADMATSDAVQGESTTAAVNSPIVGISSNAIVGSSTAVPASSTAVTQVQCDAGESTPNIPTLSQWAIVLTSALLGIWSMFIVRRTRST